MEQSDKTAADDGSRGIFASGTEGSLVADTETDHPGIAKIHFFDSNPRDLLSIYFCAGYPTLEGTTEVIRTLEKHGVNMIEIGIPFSDPMADGMVIQNAATQALRNGRSGMMTPSMPHSAHCRQKLSKPNCMIGLRYPIRINGIFTSRRM